LAVSGGTAVKTAALGAALVGSTFLFSSLRQALFSPDQWAEHKKDGDLFEWLRDLAMQRSGLNGVLDPIVQVLTNYRYLGDMQTLLNGAGPGWVMKGLQDILTGFAGANDSPNTNTRQYNAVKAGLNLVGVPLVNYGLTALGQFGGLPGRLAASAAMQFGTSPYMVGKLTEKITGPKGATRAGAGSGEAGGLPDMPGMPELPGVGGADSEGGGGGAGATASKSPIGGIPVGFLDDIALPVVRVLAPIASALPGPVKAVGAGLAAAYGAKKLLEAGAPFRGQPAPEPKAAKP
jgi:hypothetical protein